MYISPYILFGKQFQRFGLSGGYEGEVITGEYEGSSRGTVRRETLFIDPAQRLGSAEIIKVREGDKDQE